ncbi:DUF2919 family protein [Salmonella enterica]|nr:DUF2919 family protein [Salmonella enterica]
MNGHLKAPYGLWVCIIWLLLPWWLTGTGMAQQQMPDIVDSLYPSLTDCVVALVCGIPALAVCFVYPLRGDFPRTARCSYLLMLMSGLSAIGYSGFQLTTDRIRDSDAVLLQGCVLCLNLAALLFLVLNTRLWHVFARRSEFHLTTDR